jgi:gallate decarboxylase subunit D
MESKGTMSKEGSEVRSRTLSERKAGLEITAVVYELDTDCLVILFGGSRPHIGAVGMGQVRPSLKDPEQLAASSSVFTYTGHKEDMVAKALSEGLTRRMGRNTVVVAGIHWDGLTPEKIDGVRAVCRAIEDRIVNELSVSS